jgi:phosphoserine aminotransferase
MLTERCPSRPRHSIGNSLGESDSMLNTPPTYTIYIAGLVFEVAAG